MKIEVAYVSFTEDEKGLFKKAIDRWSSIANRSYPLKITAKKSNLSGSVKAKCSLNSFLDASGKPVSWDKLGSGWTGSATVEFNSSVPIDLPTCLHEIGHALGLGLIWGPKPPINGLASWLDTEGKPLSELDGNKRLWYTGAKGVAQYKNVTGVTAATCIPLEVIGTGAQAKNDFTHVESTLAEGETVQRNGVTYKAIPVAAMSYLLDTDNTAKVNQRGVEISRVSLGILEDMGYKVRYNLFTIADKLDSNKIDEYKPFLDLVEGEVKKSKFDKIDVTGTEEEKKQKRKKRHRCFQLLLESNQKTLVLDNGSHFGIPTKTGTKTKTRLLAPNGEIEFVNGKFDGSGDDENAHVNLTEHDDKVTLKLPMSAVKITLKTDGLAEPKYIVSSTGSLLIEEFQGGTTKTDIDARNKEFKDTDAVMINKCKVEFGGLTFSSNVEQGSVAVVTAPATGFEANIAASIQESRLSADVFGSYVVVDNKKYVVSDVQVTSEKVMYVDPLQLTFPNPPTSSGGTVQSCEVDATTEVFLVGDDSVTSTTGTVTNTTVAGNKVKFDYKQSNEGYAKFKVKCVTHIGRYSDFDTELTSLAALKAPPVITITSDDISAGTGTVVFRSSKSLESIEVWFRTTSSDTPETKATVTIAEGKLAATATATVSAIWSVRVIATATDGGIASVVLGTSEFSRKSVAVFSLAPVSVESLIVSGTSTLAIENMQIASNQQSVTSSTASRMTVNDSKKYTSAIWVYRMKSATQAWNPLPGKTDSIASNGVFTGTGSSIYYKMHTTVSSGSWSQTVPTDGTGKLHCLIVTTTEANLKGAMSIPDKHEFYHVSFHNGVALADLKMLGDSVLNRVVSAYTTPTSTDWGSSTVKFTFAAGISNVTATPVDEFGAGSNAQVIVVNNGTHDVTVPLDKPAVKFETGEWVVYSRRKPAVEALIDAQSSVRVDGNWTSAIGALSSTGYKTYEGFTGKHTMATATKQNVRAIGLVVRGTITKCGIKIGDTTPIEAMIGGGTVNGAKLYCDGTLVTASIVNKLASSSGLSVLVATFSDAKEVKMGDIENEGSVAFVGVSTADVSADTTVVSKITAELATKYGIGKAVYAFKTDTGIKLRKDGQDVAITELKEPTGDYTLGSGAITTTITDKVHIHAITVLGEVHVEYGVDDVGGTNRSLHYKFDGTLASEVSHIDSLVDARANQKSTYGHRSGYGSWSEYPAVTWNGGLNTQTRQTGKFPYASGWTAPGTAPKTTLVNGYPALDVRPGTWIGQQPIPDLQQSLGDFRMQTLVYVVEEDSVSDNEQLVQFGPKSSDARLNNGTNVEFGSGGANWEKRFPCWMYNPIRRSRASPGLFTETGTATSDRVYHVADDLRVNGVPLAADATPKTGKKGLEGKGFSGTAVSFGDVAQKRLRVFSHRWGAETAPAEDKEPKMWHAYQGCEPALVHRLFSLCRIERFGGFKSHYNNMNFQKAYERRFDFDHRHFWGGRIYNQQRTVPRADIGKTVNVQNNVMTFNPGRGVTYAWDTTVLGPTLANGSYTITAIDPNGIHRFEIKNGSGNYYWCGLQQHQDLVGAYHMSADADKNPHTRYVTPYTMSWKDGSHMQKASIDAALGTETTQIGSEWFRVILKVDRAYYSFCGLPGLWRSYGLGENKYYLGYLADWTTEYKIGTGASDFGYYNPDTSKRAKELWEAAQPPSGWTKATADGKTTYKRTAKFTWSVGEPQIDYRKTPYTFKYGHQPIKSKEEDIWWMAKYIEEIDIEFEIFSVKDATNDQQYVAFTAGDLIELNMEYETSAAEGIVKSTDPKTVIWRDGIEYTTERESTSPWLLPGLQYRTSYPYGYTSGFVASYDSNNGNIEFQETLFTTLHGDQVPHVNMTTVGGKRHLQVTAYNGDGKAASARLIELEWITSYPSNMKDDDAQIRYGPKIASVTIEPPAAGATGNEELRCGVVTFNNSGLTASCYNRQRPTGGKMANRWWGYLTTNGTTWYDQYVDKVPFFASKYSAPSGYLVWCNYDGADSQNPKPAPIESHYWRDSFEKAGFNPTYHNLEAMSSTQYEAIKSKMHYYRMTGLTKPGTSDPLTVDHYHAVLVTVTAENGSTKTVVKIKKNATDDITVDVLGPTKHTLKGIDQEHHYMYKVNTFKAGTDCKAYTNQVSVGGSAGLDTSKITKQYADFMREDSELPDRTYTSMYRTWSGGIYKYYDQDYIMTSAERDANQSLNTYIRGLFRDTMVKRFEPIGHKDYAQMPPCGYSDQRRIEHGDPVEAFTFQTLAPDPDDATRRPFFIDDGVPGHPTATNTWQLRTPDDPYGQKHWRNLYPVYANISALGGHPGHTNVGKICEVVAFDSRVSDTELATIENSLMRKWGIRVDGVIPNDTKGHLFEWSTNVALKAHNGVVNEKKNGIDISNLLGITSVDRVVAFVGAAKKSATYNVSDGVLNVTVDAGVTAYAVHGVRTASSYGKGPFFVYRPHPILSAKLHIDFTYTKDADDVTTRNSGLCIGLEPGSHYACDGKRMFSRPFLQTGTVFKTGIVNGRRVIHSVGTEELTISDFQHGTYTYVIAAKAATIAGMVLAENKLTFGDKSITLTAGDMHVVALSDDGAKMTLHAEEKTEEATTRVPFSGKFFVTGIVDLAEIVILTGTANLATVMQVLSAKWR